MNSVQKKCLAYLLQFAWQKTKIILLSSVIMNVADRGERAA